MPGCARGEVNKDTAPHEQGRHWAETQLLSAGEGREEAGPSIICQKCVGKGEHPHPLQVEPHTQGSPSGSAVRGTRRRGVGLLPHCRRRFRHSHLQVPPLPGVSSLAVLAVGV